MKNLLILHLESITWQRLGAFESSFPNVRRLLQRALVFDNYFSSATSTLMVITYLFHGNDYEFDAAAQFEGMRPAGNNTHLFTVLQRHGYRPNLLCLDAFHTVRGTRLAAWHGDLPPLWGTNDFPTLFARFDDLTDEPPFAIYVWDLITHIEHSLALAPYAAGLTDQLQRACRVADDAIGVLIDTLVRKSLLDDTTVVIYGDHGDDYWSHGFKGGLVHAVEPYTNLTSAPLAILDRSLAPGHSATLASTIDIAPTCLALLDVDEPLRFEPSGTNLLERGHGTVHAQNFTASQGDRPDSGVFKAFSATDDTYNLVVSSRGLEMYAYRLDPGNHCNLLQFFDIVRDGSLALRQPPRDTTSTHFLAALPDNPQAVAHIEARYHALRATLVAHVAGKRAYMAARGVDPALALDPGSLDRICGRDSTAVQQSLPYPSPGGAPFEFTFKLK